MFFINVQLSFAQDKIENIIEKATCKCIGKFGTFGNDDKEKFKNCFVQAINNNTAPLIAEAKRKYGKATEATGKKLGESIMQKLVVDMIYSCDDYYNWLEESRLLPVKNANRDSLINALQDLNTIDSSKKDADFFTKRGMVFFSLQQLDEAIADFDMAINQGNSLAALQGSFFKAWSLEIQKKYDDAEQLYSYLASVTNNNNLKVFVAIVKRKKMKS